MSAVVPVVTDAPTAPVVSAPVTVGHRLLDAAVTGNLNFSAEIVRPFSSPISLLTSGGPNTCVSFNIGELVGVKTQSSGYETVLVESIMVQIARPAGFTGACSIAIVPDTSNLVPRALDAETAAARAERRKVFYETLFNGIAASPCSQTRYFLSQNTAVEDITFKLEWPLGLGKSVTGSFALHRPVVAIAFSGFGSDCPETIRGTVYGSLKCAGHSYRPAF
jgi:hypothetical protein